MISLRLMGGFGNQIFQLSAAFLIARNSKENIIYYDDSALNRYEVARNNDLDFFFDFSKAGFSLVKNKSLFHSLRFAKIFPYTKFFVSDRNFNYSKHKYCLPFRYLDGYFQDCLTDSEFANLVDIFKTCLLPYAVLAKPRKSCLIHIRGGDFVKLGWDSVASKNYYLRAMEFMVNNHDVVNFNIITDDIPYAKSVFSSENVTLSFVNGSMQEDFYNIGSYSHQILSSSTFAFWASALGSVSNPVVIAPEFWSPGRIRNLRLPGEVYL